MRILRDTVGKCDMKTFHVTNISKGRRHVSYVIRVEDGEKIECSIPFCFYYNKDVEIYNSTILYMFETIRTAPCNRMQAENYKWIVDLEPDVDICKLRKGYQNLLLADGTGLDSHAIRMLGDASGKLKYVTIADLKGEELENIDRAEFDTDDSVVMVGENYLWNRIVGDIRLDFSHDGNRLYCLMLLIDHFKAKKVLTADCEKLEFKSYYGSTTDLYSCNFLYGDIGTSYVNARLDPGTYYDRLLHCGHYPPYKNLRKYLVAQYLQVKFGIEIFTEGTKREFFAANKINISGSPGIVEIVKSYKRQRKASGGLQLFDDFILALNTVDLTELRKVLVQTEEQACEFDALVAFAKAEYVSDRRTFDSIEIFDEGKLRRAFRDDAAFLDAVLSGMKRVRSGVLESAYRQPLGLTTREDWVPIDKIAEQARERDGLKGIAVEFSVEASVPFTLSIYYTTGNMAKFSAGLRVDAPVQKGRNNLNVNIPIGVLKKFRIDFGVKPGRVSISPIKIVGQKEIALDWCQFGFNDVESHQISEDGLLTVFSEGNDPYAVYQLPLNLLA